MKLRQKSKEEIWQEKRIGKITASTLPNLMKKGRGVKWGESAKKVLYAVKYELRTGLERPEQSNKNFDWGHENEPFGVEWLRAQMMNEVKSCSADFEQIIFCEPFEGFGDSPDAYIYDFDGNIEGVVEIKCPVDIAKIEEIMECEEITEKHEYYWQFLGHFIGTPEAKYLIWCVYDGYADDGFMLRMNRKDHIENINKLEARIKEGVNAIKSALSGEKQICQINN